MDRVLAPLKSRPVRFEMPAVRTLAELPDTANALAQAIANSEITPEDGRQMTAVLEFLRSCLSNQ
jgi:hypothetical protein